MIGLRLSTIGLLVLTLIVAGCDSDGSSAGRTSQPRRAAGPATQGESDDCCCTPAAPVAEPKPGEVKRTPLDRDKKLWLEVEGKQRRVVVEGVVCLRKAGFGLECLLCRKATKEHESILATEADARMIHAALEGANAKPGSPVDYVPKFKAPTGQRIQITLEFTHDGKRIRVPAQQWVRNVKTKKDLDQQWVFTGSKLIPDPADPKKLPLYLAQSDGCFIAISNVPTAMLDLPIDSPKGVEDRGFDTYETRIPPLGTKVNLILEPIPNTQKVAPIPEKYSGPAFKAEPSN
jgi:hypothetical protein